MRLVLCLIFLHSASMSFAKSYLNTMFTNKKPIIAALMLKLPENYQDPKERQKQVDYAMSQIKILEQYNVDSVLFEYRGGGIMKPALTEDKIQVMGEILKKVVEQSKKVVIGIEVLWHYPEATLKVAKISGAKFVRLDFFSDRMIADGKEVPINPKEVVEFRKKIEAEGIALFTDIQVKYAKMIDTKKTMTDSAKEALSKGSNGVIVSGLKSGNPPSADRVHSAKKGAPKHDVIIGSGFSYENANDLLKHADGVIVGTSISVKTGGPLVPEKVKKLMDVVNNYRKNNL